jgi:hypothetical protein
MLARVDSLPLLIIYCSHHNIAHPLADICNYGLLVDLASTNCQEHEKGQEQRVTLAICRGINFLQSLVLVM